MKTLGSGARLAVGGVVLCVVLGVADGAWSESRRQQLIFADDFESGDASAWSSTVGYLPLPGFGNLSGACGESVPGPPTFAFSHRFWGVAIRGSAASFWSRDS